jgi:molybdopterin converting factor small subunit
MKVTLLAWAQAKNILGFDQTEVEFDPTDTPRQILERCSSQVVQLSFCRIAVNQTIHGWDEAVGDAKEIAIIPPVSGG